MKFLLGSGVFCIAVLSSGEERSRYFVPKRVLSCLCVCVCVWVGGGGGELCLCVWFECVCLRVEDECVRAFPVSSHILLIKTHAVGYCGRRNQDPLLGDQAYHALQGPL